MTKTAFKGAVAPKTEVKERDDTGIPDQTPEPEIKYVKAEKVEDVLIPILSTQRGKRSVPSLVKFWSNRSNAHRYVLVDVNDAILGEAWSAYRTFEGPDADREEFLAVVYKILNTEVPRMYRAVAYTELN